MPAFSHKVQILLSRQQYQALLSLAKDRGKSLSTLLREAVIEHLLKEARRSARRKAFEEISAMALPVADWPAMEEEIERAHGGTRSRP